MKKELTPKDFATLQRNAIRAYCAAVYALADLYAIGREKYGRKALLEMTTFPSTKIDWFISISGALNRSGSLPEHLAEVVETSRPNVWLEKAKENGWTPVQLRKEIRKASKDFKKPSKKIEVSSWAKHLMLAKMELSRTPGLDHSIASSYLGDIAQCISASSCQPKTL